MRINGNKIKTKGGLAIAGALQVNTMLEELDLAETDQVMYMYLLCVKWPSCRLSGLPRTRGSIKGWAAGRLSCCENYFACLA